MFTWSETMVEQVFTNWPLAKKVPVGARESSSYRLRSKYVWPKPVMISVRSRTLSLKWQKIWSQGCPFADHPPGWACGNSTLQASDHRRRRASWPFDSEWLPVKASQTSNPRCWMSRLHWCRLSLNASLYRFSYRSITDSALNIWVSEAFMMKRACPLNCWFNSWINFPGTAWWATLMATGPGVPSPQIEPQKVKLFRASDLTGC